MPISWGGKLKDTDRWNRHGMRLKSRLVHMHVLVLLVPSVLCEMHIKNYITLMKATSHHCSNSPKEFTSLGKNFVIACQLGFFFFYLMICEQLSFTFFKFGWRKVWTILNIIPFPNFDFPRDFIWVLYWLSKMG